MKSVEPSVSPTTLILAYGNPLRGDDGAGWQAAMLLAREPKERVEVLVRHQLTPELAELLSQVEQVVFVDAALGGEPGQVACRRIEAVEAAAQPHTHYVSPADLLVSARTLYGHSPVAYLVTVNGAKFDYCEALSPAVEAALPTVLAQVEEIIQTRECCYA